MGVEEVRQGSTRDKIIWFRKKIQDNTVHFTEGFNKVEVNREDILGDSLRQFKKMDDLRKEIKVTFQNEISHDAGGISREYFSILVQELLKHEMGLFLVANTQEFSYKLNEDSSSNEKAGDQLFFFGQILGKALFDHIPLNLCLNISIYKALLGQTSEEDYEDLHEFQAIDVNVYNSLKFFMEN